MELCPSVLHYVPLPMDATSYQNKLEIFILDFSKKERLEVVFLNTTQDTNTNKMISFYSYDECCKEKKLKLIC